MNQTKVKAEVHGIVQELIQDKLRFMLTLFKVSDKERRTVPFIPQTIQASMLAAIEPPGARNVFVKPSQVGASTCIIGYYLADTITTPGTTSVIVAYEEFITERLLGKAQFFYDQIPDEYKPDQTAKSKHEKSYGAIHSVFYIGTARSYNFGRGDAIHNFLADEYAFWPDVGNIMVPVLQRVPAWGRLNVLSTPNGEDNPFHDLYELAKGEDNSWIPHFYSWMMHKEYQFGPDHPLAIKRDRFSPLPNLDDRELLLLSAGVHEDQLRWRRWKKSELRALSRSEEYAFTFEQESPEDDVSCFLTAGNMVYDVDLLSDMLQKCKPPIDYWGDWDGATTKDTKLHVWEHPDPNYRYIVALDPGMGRQTETALSVWRFFEEEDEETGRVTERGKLCARLYGLYEPEETAVFFKAVGRYYNTATLAPEVNNHGLAVLTNIWDYPNIYWREDISRNKPTKNPGWLTTPKTKPHMIKELREMLSYLDIPDTRMVSQFANIRKQRSETTLEWQFVSVGPDDIHDSAAIAMVCRQAIAVRRGFVGASGWDDKWGEGW